MNKEAQISLIDIIAGLIVIAGGTFVVFSYVNLGTFLASVGLVIEIIKLLIKQGVLS